MVGNKPEISFNFDAILPRNEALGYGGVSLDEYMAKTDVTARLIIKTMYRINELFRDYEKMMIDKDVFRDKADISTGELVLGTAKTPAPPWNTYNDLANAFDALIESTYYFQDIFSEESEVLRDERLDSKEFHSMLDSYKIVEKSYKKERKKFDKK